MNPAAVTVTSPMRADRSRSHTPHRHLAAMAAPPAGTIGESTALAQLASVAIEWTPRLSIGEARQGMVRHGKVR